MKLFSLLFFFTSISLSAVLPQEIVSKADDHRGFNSDFSFEVSVKEFSGPKNIRETRYSVLVKNEGHSLVSTLSPASQKGRKFLFVDENLWFYTPDIKRATRVSLQQRLTGEVSNGDLAHSNFRGDYIPKIIGEEKIDSKMAWKLVLKAKKKSATYPAITYWVEKNTFLPIKAVFQTASGKTLKFCEYRAIKKILGRVLITELKITDALRPTHQSVLFYSNFKREKLDDSLFNKDALGNE